MRFGFVWGTLMKLCLIMKNEGGGLERTTDEGV